MKHDFRGFNNQTKSVSERKTDTGQNIIKEGTGISEN